MDKKEIESVDEWLRDYFSETGESPIEGMDEDWDALFDEDLPEEGTPLHGVLSANGILRTADRARYAAYDPANPGCSRENPIVIGVEEDYVGLEYAVLPFLLRPAPYRFVDYRLVKQALVFDGERALDVLTVEVSEHPDLLCLSAAPESEGKVLGEEEYWFDITAGYSALARSVGQ